MYVKNALAGLLAVAVLAEASVIQGFPGSGRLVARRQRFGGFRGNRGGNNGGNNNDNDNDNNGDQNNDDQNQDQDNNDGGNQNNDNGGNNNNNNNNDDQICVPRDGIFQEASTLTGQENGGDPDQADSLTSDVNFFDFCLGKELTNGQQKTGGSCNSIPMGDIPPTNRMISTMMLFPAHNDEIPADETFDISLIVKDLQAGTFTEPQSTYYNAPQQLNGNQQIIGHMHVTCQDMGNSLNANQPLDPTQFVFFKGINDNGNGQGTLSATVDGGLPEGFYRCCTMAGASNHQPPLMPVAQRGAQDDCVRFAAVSGGGNNNNNNNDDDQDQDQNQGNNNNNNNNGNNNNGNNNNGGNNGGQDNDQGDEDQNADQDQDVDEDEAAGDSGNNGGGQGGAFANNALGGIAAPEIEDTGNDNRPFGVNGDTFVNESAAIQRACDVQNNLCSNAVNSQQLDGVSVGDCGNQVQQCVSDLS